MSERARNSLLLLAAVVMLRSAAEFSRHGGMTPAILNLIGIAVIAACTLRLLVRTP